MTLVSAISAVSPISGRGPNNRLGRVSVYRVVPIFASLPRRAIGTMTRRSRLSHTTLFGGFLFWFFVHEVACCSYKNISARWGSSEKSLRLSERKKTDEKP